MDKVFEKLPLSGVKNVIVVASGKGGVGKSTISANLAITFAKKGYKTALVDADISGPTIPKLFDVENEKPGFTLQGEKKIMEPIV